MGRTQIKVQAASEKLNSEGINCIAISGYAKRSPRSLLCLRLISCIYRDVRKYEDCERAVKETVSAHGRLDILVNGAAGNFLCPAEALSPNAFKTVIEIDLIGTFHMSRASFDELKKAQNGLIINITATLQLRGTPWQAHAMSAKAGVDALTKSLASEWSDFGIRCVGIAPGYTKGTEGLERLVPKKTVDSIVSTIVPLKRMGSKKEIALTAVYLATEAGQYINGSVVLCEGGEALFYPRAVSRDQLLAAAQKAKTKAKL